MTPHYDEADDSWHFSISKEVSHEIILFRFWCEQRLRWLYHPGWSKTDCVKQLSTRWYGRWSQPAFRYHQPVHGATVAINFVCGCRKHRWLWKQLVSQFGKVSAIVQCCRYTAKSNRRYPQPKGRSQTQHHRQDQRPKHRRISDWASWKGDLSATWSVVCFKKAVEIYQDAHQAMYPDAQSTRISAVYC